jgi:UDP-2,4-diacetamido-2,4,6-trideoxy-beta-L-altropyranose hydrolase
MEIINENNIDPDLFVLDHYALDYRFERKIRYYAEYILVIDDLADRRHDCDILLDQNLQPNILTRYNNLVPENCLKLLGPQYALLRPEFGEERRRMKPRDGKVERMLVFFGGIDKDNVTAMALNALTKMNLDSIAIDVVIGGNNPHRSEIEKIVQKMGTVSLHCQVTNFAHLMAEADLALCASGTTTWERCALGLPTLMIAVAENQVTASVACHEAGVAQYLGKFGEVTAEIIKNSLADMLASPGRITEMGKKAQELVDAKGCERVSQIIAEKGIGVKI